MAHPITGEISADSDLDPMLRAVAGFIVSAGVLESGADLSEFTRKNVTVIPPQAEDKEIEEAINASIQKAKGLSLLLIGGSAKNVDPNAPGPMMTVEMELQLYVHPKSRPAGSRTPLQLVVALLRGLHEASIQPKGFEWYETIRSMGYDPVPDPDCVAYSLTFERDMSF